MKETYVVNIREVWIQPIEIEALSEKEALQKVENGEGKYVQNQFEYSHTLELDFWSVDKIIK